LPRKQVTKRALKGTLGRRVDDLREAQGLSRYALWQAMKAVGYTGTRDTVYRPLSGKVLTPSGEFARAAAAALGVSADEILYGADKPDRANLRLARMVARKGESPEKLSRQIGASRVKEAVKLLRQALTSSLQGSRSPELRGDVGRYAKAAAPRALPALFPPVGKQHLFEGRLNAMTRFGRTLYDLDIPRSPEEFGTVMGAAAEHLARAEEAGARRKRRPRRRGTGDLAEIQRDITRTYGLFADRVLAGFMVTILHDDPAALR